MAEDRKTRASSAGNQQDEDRVTVERAEGAPDAAPLSVTTPKYQEPGPDVSNADVDLARVSADAAHSEYVVNPDPNPNGEFPPPGPSVIQVLGLPSEERVNVSEKFGQ